jgi:hypothetical protein
MNKIRMVEHFRENDYLPVLRDYVLGSDIHDLFDLEYKDKTIF